MATKKTNAPKGKTSSAATPKKARPEFDKMKLHSLTDAVKLVKECARANFDESVEIAVALGVDPRHSDQIVRGTCPLPHGTGKSIRICAIVSDAKIDEAKKAGADVVGNQELVDNIVAGKQALDFDRIVATPDMMVVLAKAAKILGPKGLMPNPKLGTVTPDVAGAIQSAKAGSIEFRAEKAGIVHAGVGKVSFDDAKIAENIKTVVDALNKAKPSGAKGTYMKKMTISSSMGPGVKVDLASVAA